MQVQAALESQPPVDVELALFQTLSPKRRRLWLPLLSSIGIHGAILTLVTWIGSLPVHDGFDLSNYKVEPLRLAVTAPLYYPEEPKPAKASAGADRPKGSAKVTAPAAPPKTEIAANPEPPPEPAPRPALKPFELPPALDKAHDGPVILQPEYLPQAPQLKTAIPSMSLWSKLQPNARPIRKLVIPGRPNTPPTPAPAPKLSAPPVVSVPNRELAAADINVALPQVRVAPPALPVQNSTTNPIRVREEKNEPTAAPTDPTIGQAVNLIAISNNRPPLAVVEIPKGLQNIPTSGGADGDGATSASAAGSQNRGGRSGQGASTAPANTEATNRLGNPKGEKPAGNGRDDSRPGTGSSKSEAGEKPGAGKPGQGDASTPQGEPHGLPSAGSNGAGNSAVTRIVHPPAGSFDVVLMQAGARDDLPDLGGILGGNPVYTVYLKVGEEKEWLLEFCLPARPKAQSNPYQIDIDDVGSIAPPYPVSTVVPNSILGQPRPKAVVLHGYLSATGGFRDVKSTDAKNAVGVQLLPFLNQWQFRPALQNNKPVEVEILLVVPPRT